MSSSLLSHFPPEFYVDSTLIRQLYCQVQSHNLDASSPAPSKSDVSKLSEIHSIDAMYDHFLKFLECRGVLRDLHNRQAYSNQSLLLRSEVQRILPSSDTCHSTTTSATLLLQLQTVKFLSLLRPEVVPIIFTDFTTLLSNLSCSSLSSEDPRSWLTVVQIIGELGITNSHDFQIQKQALELILLIGLTTGNIAIILSFISSSFGLPSSLSFPCTTSLSSISPPLLLSNYLSSPIEICPFSLPSKDSCKIFQFFSSIFYTTVPSSILNATSKIIVFKGFLFVFDAVGISKYGIGRKSVQGKVYGHQKWGNCGEKFGEIFENGFKFWVAILNNLLVMGSYDLNEIFTVSSKDLSISSYPIRFDCTPAANTVYSIFGGKHCRLGCVKREQINDKATFSFSYISNSANSIKFDCWMILTPSVMNILTENLSVEDFQKYSFIYSCNHLCVIGPTDNQMSKQFSILTVNNQSITATSSGQFPLSLLTIDDFNQFITVNYAEHQSIISGYPITDPFYYSNLIDSECSNQIVDVSQKSVNPKMISDYLLSMIGNRLRLFRPPVSHSINQFAVNQSPETFELLTSLLSYFWTNQSLNNLFYIIEILNINLWNLSQSNLISWLPCYRFLKICREILLSIVVSDHSNLSVLAVSVLTSNQSILYPTFRDRSKLLIDLLSLMENQSNSTNLIDLLHAFTTLPFLSSYLIGLSESESLDFFGKSLEKSIDGKNFIDFSCSDIFDLKELNQIVEKSFSTELDDDVVDVFNHFLIEFTCDLSRRLSHDAFPNLVKFSLEFFKILISQSKISSSHDINSPLMTVLLPFCDTLYSINPDIFDCFDLVNDLINQSIQFLSLLQSIRSSLPPLTPVSLLVPRTQDSGSGPVLIGSKVVESRDGNGNVIHPYENNQDYCDEVDFPGAKYLTLEFDPQCRTERRYDYLIVARESNNNNQIGKYSGRDSDWPKSIIRVDDCSRLFFSFHSDGSNVEWGYKVTVKAYGLGFSPLPQLNLIDNLISTLSNLIAKMIGLILIGNLSPTTTIFDSNQLPSFLTLSSTNSELFSELVNHILMADDCSSMSELVLQFLTSFFDSKSRDCFVDLIFPSIFDLFPNRNFLIGSVLFYFNELISRSKISITESEVYEYFASNFADFTVDHEHSVLGTICLGLLQNFEFKNLEEVKTHINLTIKNPNFDPFLVYKRQIDMVNHRLVAVKYYQSIMSSDLFFLRVALARIFPKICAILSTKNLVKISVQSFTNPPNFCNNSGEIFCRNIHLFNQNDQETIKNDCYSILNFLSSRIFPCLGSLSNGESIELIELSAIMSSFAVPLSQNSKEIVKNTILPLLSKVSTQLSHLSTSSNPSISNENDSVESEDEDIDPDFLMALTLAAEEDGGEQGEFARRMLKDINEKRRIKEEKKLEKEQVKKLASLNKFDQLSKLSTLIVDFLNNL
ncbi:hypothetical protein RCL1_000496 [Eukaryota sp. TZLM3-RCL]